MQQKLRTVFIVIFLSSLGVIPAHAGKIALLLEQPYGRFGFFNPTGHAAIYLSDVCADTPISLRRCYPGEKGVVISRYHKVAGYDWLAIPLIPYLYAVKSPENIPEDLSEKQVMRLRNQYRRRYLREYVPDDPHRAIPKGDWTQLLGESYDRKIFGYELETTPEQDNALIAMLNGRKNHNHFNLFFNNCANFTEKILNFYFPHSIHRNFVVDLGLMTPKQTAHSFTRYARHHSDLEFTTFVVPQVSGPIRRSIAVHGILDSVLETPKYALPIAILQPIVAGSLLAVYFGDGRFHPDAHMESVFDPKLDPEPGMLATTDTRPRENVSDETGISIEIPERTATQTITVAATQAIYQPVASRPSD
ncbi:MAG: hypothetical protein ACRD3F_00185 [Acidobacteriaceae bacterium]